MMPEKALCCIHLIVISISRLLNSDETVLVTGTGYDARLNKWKRSIALFPVSYGGIASL